MKRLITMILMIAAAATSISASIEAAAGKPPERVTISPSSTCTLSFDIRNGMTARILDHERIEVSWRVGKREVRTQIRVSCEDGPIERLLREEGFSQVGANWELAAGAVGSSSAKAIGTPSWHGVIGTYFLGGVCRTAVGQSPNGKTHFSFGVCIAESEYPYAKKRFNRLEQFIILERATR